MLVDPGVPIGPAIQRAHRPARCRAPRPAGGPAAAVRCFLEFAGDAVLVAHNARFDLAFLDRETERLTVARLAGPWSTPSDSPDGCSPVGHRAPGLASLAHFFGTGARPCHRALPDACATDEILLRLIGLAQERGARTVADLTELAAPRLRRVYAKASSPSAHPRRRASISSATATTRSSTWVGHATCARDSGRTSARTDSAQPSKQRSPRSNESSGVRPGRELEAALDELDLLRDLRPPANARNARPDRYVYLRRRGAGLVCSQTPTALWTAAKPQPRATGLPRAGRGIGG